MTSTHLPIWMESASPCPRRYRCAGAELIDRYSRLGGLQSADDLVLIAHCLGRNGLSRVARAIVDRRLLALNIGGRFLAPRFQFTDKPLEVMQVVIDVMRELDGVCEDNELAAWFVAPNIWLDQEVPCELVKRKPLLVLEAARADRRVAAGW